VSAGGYAVAPIPSERPLLDNYIEQRDLPEWAPRRAIWLPIL
jgi:hypothetical protein